MLHNKFIIIFFFILTLISCNKNDDASNEQLNGFSYDNNFYELDNAYYYITSSAFGTDEFFLILTNGKVESFSILTNSFVYSQETTSTVVLKGGKISEVPIPTNRIPTGSYNFDENGYNETSDYIVNSRFNFDCIIDFDINSLENCQISINTLSSAPSSASLNIEYNDTSKEYILTYDFDFSDDGKITGDFRGPVEISNQILSL